MEPPRSSPRRDPVANPADGFGGACNHSRRSGALLVILGLAALLGGCGYLKQRLEDAGDMVFASAGTGFGLSVSGFISPVEPVVGMSASNVYGWEGRSMIHRKEVMISAFPVLVLNMARQEDSRGGSWWQLPSPALPREPHPYLATVQEGLMGLQIRFLEGNEFSPEIPINDPVTAGWGVGFAVTPGFFSVRFGVRPSGVVNFITGWFGFHVLPPYKFLSNDLDHEHLRDRGILWPEAERNLAGTIVSDLKHPSEVVRVHSAKTLGLMGAAARDHVEALRPLAADPDIRVRVHAIVALNRIDPAALDAPAALAAISPYWRTEEIVKAAIRIVVSDSRGDP